MGSPLPEGRCPGLSLSLTEGSGTYSRTQDKLMGLPEEPGCTSIKDWVKCHHVWLTVAYDTAGKHRRTEMTRQKEHYDRNAEVSPLLTGKGVLVRDKSKSPI
ncbi:hypothetical protein UPYG_G00075750 [Umbra pygmaea]|uniref:Uncharacterized protein n=1 Tax=Umbra pygmaea TaxID=75934 RepID=A0ABD0XUG0_UMBPY